MSVPRKVIDDEGIVFPVCRQHHLDDIEDYIDWWGRTGLEFRCHACDRTFIVNEIVERRWESVEILEEETKE